MQNQSEQELQNQRYLAKRTKSGGGLNEENVGCCSFKASQDPEIPNKKCDKEGRGEGKTGGCLRRPTGHHKVPFSTIKLARDSSGQQPQTRVMSICYHCYPVRLPLQRFSRWWRDQRVPFCVPTLWTIFFWLHCSLSLPHHNRCIRGLVLLAASAGATFTAPLAIADSTEKTVSRSEYRPTVTLGIFADLKPN